MNVMTVISRGQSIITCPFNLTMSFKNSRVEFMSESPPDIYRRNFLT